jgi:anti-anti-sigma factor
LSEGAVVTAGAPNEDGDEEFRLLARRPRPDVIVVEIGGELDLVTAPRVTEYLRAEVAADRVPHVALDLTAVSFMSSHGVAMLVTALNELRQSGQLHLVGVANNRRVRRVLELTGMVGLFADHADADELLIALGGLDGR